MSKAIERNYIQEFRSAFAAGIESIVQAANIYVTAIDDDPAMVDQFRETFAESIPTYAWKRFEAVGRKWIHPNLLLGGGGKYANKIKMLPYSTQERIFDGDKFELLTTDGDTLMVDPRTITVDQAKQLYDSTHIRTLAEQRVIIEDKRQKEMPVEATMPYTIQGGKVSFRKGTVLTRPEIKRLLQEM